jgi:hypothetical protein
VAVFGSLTFDVILKARGLDVEGNVGTIEVPLLTEGDRVVVGDLEAAIRSAFADQRP